MTDDIIIRRSTIEDASAMNAYTSALADEGLDTITGQRYTMEQTVEFIKKAETSERAFFLNASRDGEIIGALSLFAGERASDRHAGRLGMGVMKEFRNRGIGRRLLDAAITESRQWPGFCRIELDVVPWNAPAIRLYESMGFQYEGTKRKGGAFRKGEPHDVLLMALVW